MLDSLIKSLGPEIFSAVTEKFGLSKEQASDAVDTTKNSLERSVSKEIGDGNLDGLLSVLNSRGNAPENSTFQTLAGKLSGDYIEKLGLSPNLASQISTYVLPLVLSKISSMTGGGNMDKEGLLKMLGPGVGNLLKGKAGEILKGGLGGLFK